MRAVSIPDTSTNQHDVSEQVAFLILSYLTGTKVYQMSSKGAGRAHSHARESREKLRGERVSYHGIPNDAPGGVVLCNQDDIDI